MPKDRDRRDCLSWSIFHIFAVDRGRPVTTESVLLFELSNKLRLYESLLFELRIKLKPYESRGERGPLLRAHDS